MRVDTGFAIALTAALLAGCGGAGVSDPSGSASRAVDFTTAPASSIAAGSSWSFQYWYRDPLAGGSGFNLSNGLRAAFHP